MSRFVLDASIVLTWCFPDEQSQKADLIAEKIAAGESVVVTSFWAQEILNALLVGERKLRITAEETKAFLEGLKGMVVVIDTVPPETVFDTLQALCRKHGLTSYDASYLEIAMRQNCSLASVDKVLIRAAEAENVALL